MGRRDADEQAFPEEGKRKETVVPALVRKDSDPAQIRRKVFPYSGGIFQGGRDRHAGKCGGECGKHIPQRRRGAGADCDGAQAPVVILHLPQGGVCCIEDSVRLLHGKAPGLVQRDPVLPSDEQGDFEALFQMLHGPRDRGL